MPPWLLPAVGAALVLGVIAWFVIRGSGGPDAVRLVQAGIEAVNRGDFDAAVEAFSAVPAGHRLHGQAQERLLDAQEQRASLASMAERREADVLAALVQSIRKDWIERFGPGGAQYAQHTRYLLKRAQEFVERYPDDPRAVEMRAYPSYYRNVASLDRPPSLADLKVEIEWRTQADEYTEAAAAVDAFAAQPGVSAAEVDALRLDLQERAEASWQVVKARLGRRQAFEAGNENWKQIRSETARYLKLVQAIEGVGAEARELNTRAEAALSGTGG